MTFDRTRKYQQPAAKQGDDSSPQSLRPSNGRPLEAPVRAEMEAKLGHSFDDVRIHTGAEASIAAESLGACAYTAGKDVVFHADQYNPWSADGRELLAHELAHTVQTPDAATSLSHPGDAGEREATAAGRAVAAGRSATVGQAPGAAISRDPYPNVMSGKPGSTTTDPQLDVSSPFMAAAIGSTTLDNFATGKADLTPSHLGQIAMQAQTINRLLRRHGTSTVEIVGHTDTVGEEGNNFRLGQARADAVKEKLVQAGVSRGIVTANSAGETGRQAVQTKDQVPNAKNRRVEIIFKPGRSYPNIMTGGLTLDPPGTSKKKDDKKPFDWGSIGPGGVRKNPLDKGPIFPEPEFGPPKPPSLPPDFWKPIPELKKDQKSVLDRIGEQFLDPVIDDLFGFLDTKKRAWLKEKAREAVAEGATAGAKAAAEALGVKDRKVLEGIEKAVEAGIKYKGEKPKERTD